MDFLNSIDICCAGILIICRSKQLTSEISKIQWILRCFLIPNVKAMIISLFSRFFYIYSIFRKAFVALRFFKHPTSKIFRIQWQLRFLIIPKNYHSSWIIPNVKAMIFTFCSRFFSIFFSIFRVLKAFVALGFLYFAEENSSQAISLKYNAITIFYHTKCYDYDNYTFVCVCFNIFRFSEFYRHLLRWDSCILQKQTAHKRNL